MDLTTELLAVLLAGLGLILAVIAGTAARRYHDARLGGVAAALALLALIGGLALLNQLSPRYGGPFAVAAIPLGLAVLAVALLYIAFVTNRPKRPSN